MTNTLANIDRMDYSPAMKYFEAVIFDLGRVLVGIDIDRYMRIFGNGDTAADTAALKSIMSDELVVNFDTGRITPNQFYDAIREKTGINIPYDEFVAGYCDIFTPMPGIERLFGEIKAKLPVGLLSDTDPLHFASICERFKYVAEIENPSLSFNIGAMKPDPVMYQTAAKNVNIDIDKCLFIDDLQRNVDGAIRAGMQAILFEGVENLRQQLVYRGLL